VSHEAQQECEAVSGIVATAGQAPSVVQPDGSPGLRPPDKSKSMLGALEKFPLAAPLQSGKPCVS
jgi:hypothetical protein